MIKVKTLRNVARAASELNARFNGESNKGDSKVIRGDAGFPNRPTSRDLLTRLGMSDKDSAKYLADKRTTRQRNAASRVAMLAARFTMPERAPEDVEDAAMRITFHRANVSGQNGTDDADKARLAARMAGFSAKMETDSNGRRVNGSDPFAAMRAECNARIGLGIGFERKAPSKRRQPDAS